MTISSNYPSIRPSLLLDFARSKRLDPRITFTRTTTATYYDGETEAKAEENLLKYSQDFDNATWSKTATTVSANATNAPDGTTTAEEFTPTTALNSHSVFQDITAVSGAVYTLSVYAKTNGYDLQMTFGGGDVSGNPYANFDLTSGTVAVDTGLSATIESAGSGFYRCIVSATAAVSSSFTSIVGVIDNTSRTRGEAYTGDGSSGIYVWGAQLEQRSSVTAYTPTTTQPITNYIPVLLTANAGVARFDHDPVTEESLGLLVEEQRTNLLLRSEDSSATWSAIRLSASNAAIIAPSGALTGIKLVPNTDNNSHRIVQVATTSAGSWTASTYFKAGEYSGVEFRIADGTSTVSNSGARTTIDLLTGTLSSTSFYGANATAGSASITPVGNGWYRAAVTVTVTSSALNLQAQIYVQSVAGTVSYTGDGYSGIYIWGAQLEAGAFPTSYIPTVASTVTRTYDAASMTGTNFSSWYRGDEGSIYAELSLLTNDVTNTTQRIVTIHDGDPTVNSIRPYVGTSEVIILFVERNNSTSSVATSNSVPDTTSPFKIAMALGYQDVASCLNSGTVATSSSVYYPTEVNQMDIGAYSSQRLSGHFKKIAYYPVRLTNTNLQALTGS